jgi:hypothetical protein
VDYVIRGLGIISESPNFQRHREEHDTVSNPQSDMLWGFIILFQRTNSRTPTVRQIRFTVAVSHQLVGPIKSSMSAIRVYMLPVLQTWTITSP